MREVRSMRGESCPYRVRQKLEGSAPAPGLQSCGSPPPEKDPGALIILGALVAVAIWLYAAWVRLGGG